MYILLKTSIHRSYHESPELVNGKLRWEEEFDFQMKDLIQILCPYHGRADSGTARSEGES